MHTLALTVQIFDTDCYGVMWHGAYAKWLEMGRVALMKQLGVPMAMPSVPGQTVSAPQGLLPAYLYPVAEQHLSYRSPARLDEEMLLTTAVSLEGFRLRFLQRFVEAQRGRLVVEATTICVAVEATTWKPVRRLPEALQTCLLSLIGKEA